MRGMRRSTWSKSTSMTRRMRSATSTRPTSSRRRRGPEPRLQLRRRPRQECPMSAQPKSLIEASCADYDPNSMPVDRARAVIRALLTPVTSTERVHIRQALDRVLACEVVSPHDVPGHDSSAMDGYAVRFADLAADRETLLVQVGESFAGKPAPVTVGPGQCVRIFTGGVIP